MPRIANWGDENDMVEVTGDSGVPTPAQTITLITRDEREETEFRADLVAALESYMEQARTGQLREFVLVAKGEGDLIEIRNAPTLSVASRIGMLEMAKLLFFAGVDKS